MNFCPNKSHPDWIYIVENFGEKTAYRLYVINGFQIPTKEETQEYIKPRKAELGSGIPSDPNIKWLKDKLGMDDNEVSVIAGLVNNNALGAFLVDGKIIISEFADDATTYHEAFHRVFNMYASDSERQRLFDEVRKRNNYDYLKGRYEELYGELDENGLIEEILAEEFSEYVINDKKEEGFFKQLLNFIKKLLGLDISSSREMYQRINDSYYKGKKVIPEYTKRLNGDRYRKVSIGNVELTSNERQELFNSIDVMFMRGVFLDNPYNFFKKELDISSIYKTIKADILRSLVDKYNTEGKEGKDNSRIKLLIQALNSNFRDVIHEHNNRLNNAYGIKLNVEKLDDVDLNDPLTYENEVQSRNGLDIRASIEFNTKDAMPKVIKMLLGSIYKVDKQGNFTKNSFNLPEQTDWNKLSNLLVNQLVGLTTIDRMIGKMKSLSDRNPEVLQVIDILNDYEDTFNYRNNFDKENNYKLDLRNQFTQAFAKTKYNYLLQIIGDDGVIKIIDANSDQIQDKILREWESSFIKNISGLSKDEIKVKLDKLGNSREVASFFGISFTDESNYLKQAKLLENVRTYSKNGLDNLEKKGKDFTKLITDKDSKVNFRTLAQIEAKERDIVDLQFINAEGKTVYGVSLNTYQSLVIDKINDVITNVPKEQREEVLKKELPHLFNVNTQNSVWLKKILKENNLFVNNLFDAFKYEDGDSMSIQDLKETDLYALFLNTAINGRNMSIKHSDRSMYPTYNFSDRSLVVDPLVKSKENFIKEAIPIFEGYLKDAYNRKFLGEDFKYYKENRNNANIFSKILDKEDFDNYPNLSESYIQSKIRKYLEDSIQEVYNQAKDWKLLEKYGNREHIGISPEALEVYKNAETYITGATINSLINHIEETKLLSGDPSFYKNADDTLKRLGTQTSTGEVMIVDDENNAYIQYLNERDTITIGDETFSYTKFGKKTINGTITELVFEDADFISKVLDEIKDAFRISIKKDLPNISDADLERKVNLYSSAYGNYNENDGISLMNIFALRESMHRSGNWGDTLQNTFDEELKVLAGKSAYTVPQEIDYKDISNWFNKKYTPFAQQKYQYVGPNYGMPKEQYELLSPEERLNPMAVRKTSYYVLTPSIIKGTHLEQLNNWMLKEGVDTIHMFSAAKVGARKLRNMYDVSGNETTGVNLASITEEEKGYLDFRYMKKQVEISPKEKKEILSSTQSRKNLIEGLINNGVPKDFTQSKEVWDNLGEEEKLKVSPIYKLVKDYEKIQSQIIITNLNALLEELDAVEGLNVESYKSLAQIALQAAKDRNSPDNILDSLENWANDLFYMETLPNSEKIQNILNSLITSRVLNQKRLGTAMPQASVTLLEEGKRSIRDGKIETSDALQFYDIITDNEGNIIEVIPAEIIMPLPVSWLGNAMRLAKTRNIMEAVDYINERIDEGKMYFEIKALRIPNQQLSSNDIFRVKKFSYPQYQQSVVVPSELVAKTGGDFDIDKLQMYFYHRDHNFVPYNFLDDSNSTVSERTKALVDDPRAILNIYSGKDTSRLREYFNTIDTVILENEQAIEEVLSTDPQANMLLQIRRELKQKLKEEGLSPKDKRTAIDSLDDVNASLIQWTSMYDMEIQIQRNLKKEILEDIAEAIKDLPIELQNTTKAIDNKLLELERQLILHPLQVKSLLAPVVDDELKSFAKRNVSESERKKSYPDLLTIPTNVKAYIDFVGGKAGVGQYATWITHAAIAQVNGFRVNGTFNSGDDVISTTLPFEGLEDNYSTANPFNADDNEIVLQLSQLLTSQVDNVKDPYAVALQIVTQTNNVISYMTLRGVPLDTILNFLSQPAIKDYLKAQRTNESQIIKSTGRFNEKRNPEGKELSKDKLLEQVLSKYPEGESDVLINKKMLMGKQDNVQRLMLEAFLNLQKQAISYNKVKNFLSPDTKFLKNKNDAKQVVVNLRNDVIQENIVSFGLIEKAISDGSLLSGFYEGRQQTYELFKDLFLLENPDIETLFENKKSQLTKPLRGEDSKNKAINLLEQEFINYVLQKNYIQDKDFERLMTGDSFPKRIAELKKKYPNNAFLNEMVPIINASRINNLGIDNLKAYRGKMLADENNTLINSLEELLELEDIGEDLVKFNILQAGTKNGPLQLFKFIPYNLYTNALESLADVVITQADINDFFPKFLSLFPEYVPSWGQAKALELDYHRQKGKVYFNGSELPKIGEKYKWSNYRKQNIQDKQMNVPVVPLESPEKQLPSQQEVNQQKTECKGGKA